MEAPLTFIHQRNFIDQMSKREQSALLNQLIDAQLDLYSNEEKLLNPRQLKKYASLKLQRERFLEPNEFDSVDAIQKFFYLGNGMRLDTTNIDFFDKIDDSWRDNFIISSLSVGKSIPKQIFDNMSGKEKRYYVNRKLVNSIYFEDYEIPYLYTDNQKKMITQLIGRGEALSPEKFEALTKGNQKFYQETLKKRLSEQYFRKVIRFILSESH